jgi:Growth-Arrest-Specific Protein 2 Domain
LADEA